MNYKMLLENNLIFLSILIIPLMQSSADAGAWTQKKGSGYYKFDFRYLSGEKIYTPDGIKKPIPKFTDITGGVFGSYGFTDEFTGFIGAALYKSVKLNTTSEAFGSDTDVSGFGDIALGGKYRLVKFGKSVVSGKLILVLPTGKSEPDSGLWIGSNDFHQTLGFEHGYSLYPIPAYLNAGISFSNRAKGFSDLFNYAIEAGYRFIKNLSLIVRLHGQISFENGDKNIYGGFGTYSNNQQFIAYNAELVYKFTNSVGIKGYYESGTNGKNIISAPVFNVGLFFAN
ncbi:MAG: hypothetical protein WBH40_14420 [Ignavibacteriaceae bacterium]|jgi:hypothetical protein